MFTYLFTGKPYFGYQCNFSLFDNCNAYDFSELFVYTILLPFVIHILVRCFTCVYKTYKQHHVYWQRFFQKIKLSIIEGLNNIKQNRKTNDKKVSIQNQVSGQSPQTVTAKEIKTMTLFRRFVGSMIDKTLLLVIFIVGYLFISPYGAPGKLGTYHGLLSASPNVYEYIDIAEMKRYNWGEYYEGISKGFQEKERLESKPPHIGSTKELDMNITFSFILLNLIYYVLFESILSASFGKFIFRGKLQNCNNEKVSFVRVFARAFCGGLFMTIAVLFLHFQLGLSYYYVFLLFFFVMDIPVLFVKRSLLDICTGTKYVQRN